jgi:peptidoglycan/LPS O-acetylase OafA/YrhL
MNKPASLYVDVLRLAAALVVFVVHAHYLLPGGMPGLWWLAGLGGEAVTVFFVLSGFVIAHVVHTREFRATDYLASRFARLYSVVLPALLVTILFDYAGAALAPNEYAASMTGGASSIAASLLFANEMWFAAIRPLSNTPFWSLGYEFWYYMLYAAACYVPGRGRKCAAILLLCAICGPKILLLMPVWLLGVAAHALTGSFKPGPLAAVLLAMVTAAGLALLVMSGAKAQWHAFTVAALGVPAGMLGPSGHVLYSLAFGLLAALHVFAMVTVAPMFRIRGRTGERAVRTTSAYTFAIYLFHYPILKFLVVASAAAGLGVLRAPVIVVLSLVLIAVLGRASDRLKPALKRWFKVRLAALASVRLRGDARISRAAGKATARRGH